MSTQTYNSKRTAADEAGAGSLPSTLDTTGSKLVYLYVNTVGETTVKDINRMLDMEMLTLLPTLGTLEAAGLVERHGDTVRVTA
jgi:DNA-binding HxlR family transcriptional regulator